VFVQAHFEAKSRGLRGLAADELPDLRESLKANWPTLVPPALLIAIIASGSTPYLAAFTGISSCILVGMFTARKGTTLPQAVALVVSHLVLLALITGEFGAWSIHVFAAMLVVVPLARRGLAVASRIGPRDLVAAFETGAKYALAVGAAAATVGIIVGVVALTGAGFKISFIVTAAAQSMASGVLGILPAGWVDLKTLTLLAALVMTALVCMLMGCGLPTTATYIIMVTVAAPTLGLLGVAPLVAHFFVFYYGVLADIAPPVALAAYAAARMAGADPFRTGITAFRLGLGKVVVPFVFVFAPSLLLVVPGFTWAAFAVAFTGCLLGITFLGAAMSKFLLVPMRMWERVACAAAALLMVAPGVTGTLIGLAMVVPVMVRQIVALQRPGTA
jgi:TRAP transporter 4TM/12TM fusion protein